MKTVILSQELVEFKKEFEDLDSSSKIYRTTAHSPKSSFHETFVTSSKDLHLEFGRLSEELKWEIAVLIRRELDETGGVLLMRSRKDSSIAVMATLANGDDSYIHLSKVGI